MIPSFTLERFYKDHLLFEPWVKQTIFVYRTNFVNIHHRIKSFGIEFTIISWSYFPFLFDNIQKNEAFGLILGPPVWPTEYIFHSIDAIQNGSSFYNIHPRIKCLT